AMRSPSAPPEVTGGASYLVAADPARGAGFLVEETGVGARWASSAYRRGALGAKTVAAMVPSCPTGSMVSGGLRLLQWWRPAVRRERSRLGDFTHSPPGPEHILFHGGSTRSEERRVGKECRSRWWAYH